jgi:prevent-host-death family protein
MPNTIEKQQTGKLRQWALQDAKARFSKLVNQALSEGPQHITRHGLPAVVVLAEKDYAAMIADKRNLVDFLAQSPLKGVELGDLRDRDMGREVDL